MSLDSAELLHLYWHASPPTGHYLANLCRSWADALDNFRYTPMAEGWVNDLVECMARTTPNWAPSTFISPGPAPSSRVRQMPSRSRVFLPLNWLPRRHKFRCRLHQRVLFALVGEAA
ncbi:MAG: hypothetical protein M5R42_03015 [Rhodocyclaceae bacterium]|nr:hypothetical protein [Rhodocyclaceae bacterium]